MSERERVKERRRDVCVGNVAICHFRPGVCLAFSFTLWRR